LFVRAVYLRLRNKKRRKELVKSPANRGKEGAKVETLFKYNRRLLSKLCRSAYESLLIFLCTPMKLLNGVPGVVMAVQTFGEYPAQLKEMI
jgi:hypothetical protein